MKDSAGCLEDPDAPPSSWFEYFHNCRMLWVGGSLYSKYSRCTVPLCLNRGKHWERLTSCSHFLFIALPKTDKNRDWTIPILCLIWTHLAASMVTQCGPRHKVTDGLCASDLSRSPQVNRCRQRRTTGESEKGEDYIFRSVMAVAHLVLISIEHHAQE